MDNLKINTGEVRLIINDDPDRVIQFNPEDLGFAERVYALSVKWSKLEKTYQERAAALDKSDAPWPEKSGLLREVCDTMKQSIDEVFGAGTSATAFGDTVSLFMFDDFFNGVTPYIERIRRKKMDRYTGKRSGRVLK